MFISYIHFTIQKWLLLKVDRAASKWRQVQKLAAAHLFDVVDLDQSEYIEQHEFTTILRYIKYNKSVDETEVDTLMRSMGASDADEIDEHGHQYRLLRLSRSDFIKSAKPGGIIDSLAPKWAFEAEINRLWSQSMSNMLVVLFLMHAPISKKLFAFFACHNVGGRYYLRSE